MTSVNITRIKITYTSGVIIYIYIYDIKKKLFQRKLIWIFVLINDFDEKKV